MTLLVIPAADLHPIGARAPALAAWLRNRVACGDTVAQHGLVHKAVAIAPWPRSILAGWQGGAATEFPGLGPARRRRRGGGLGARGFGFSTLLVDLAEPWRQDRPHERR